MNESCQPLFLLLCFGTSYYVLGISAGRYIRVITQYGVQSTPYSMIVLGAP
jgi:hypothetical protein